MRDPRGTRCWRKFREGLYRRDRATNAACWICGQPIDYRAEPGTPDAWEPDHVVPVAQAPDLAFDPGNVRPAHCSCNRSRGDRRGSLGIGKPTRNW